VQLEEEKLSSHQNGTVIGEQKALVIEAKPEAPKQPSPPV